ncbi:MAG: complex I NDUFA9 subunit family protein [Pseudomonadota bacterium]
MSSTAPLVTIFGGSGFVGRYIAWRMARAGWRVRVAVRRPNEAGFVRAYGDVGQVEPIQANVRDEPSTARAIEGADAVVNCVGILVQDAWQKFDAVQAEAPGRIARLATAAGAERMLHVSAIGADAQSPAAYARTKAQGEAAVLEAFPAAVILRPSIVFGAEDQFFNRFAAMARFSPAIPVVGAETRFQPVYVDDVAMAAEAALTGDARGIFELGGPDVETFRQLMVRMLGVIRRRRLVLTLPSGIAHIQAGALSLAQTLSLGLFTNTLITRDQIRLLGRDNVVADGMPGLDALNVTPTAMDAVLESYLYAHRPHGQYTEIVEYSRDRRS